MQRLRKKRFDRVFMGGTMLLLSSLSLASVAFGAWTVGGDSYLLDGGSLQVAPILDASKYVSDAGFTCTDFCDQGFVKDSTIVYEGTLEFRFRLETGLSTDVNEGSLANLFGPDGIPIYVDVSYSADFGNDFFANGMSVTLGGIASAALSNVSDTKNGKSITFISPYAQNGSGYISVAVTLSTPSDYRSTAAFQTIANHLEAANVVFDVWLGR